MRARNLIVIMSCLFVATTLLGGCGKNKANPLAPTDPTQPGPTATPTPQPGKATINVITKFDNNPISNVTTNIQFVGKNPMTMQTNNQGVATYVVDDSGEFSATIPAQGEILESVLSGYATLGQSVDVNFLPGGSFDELTPTAINYDFSGGTFPIEFTFNSSEYPFKVNYTPSVINLPAGWTAVFTNTQMSHGDNTVNITVPGGSEDNAMNLKIQLLGQSVVSMYSSAFAIYRDWQEYADIKVIVKEGETPLQGINYTITDSAGDTYPGTTDVDGTKTIRINKTGSYSIHFAAQGSLDEQTINGTISQGELKTHNVNVVYADINVKVINGGDAYPLEGINISITDASSTVYNGTTDSNGYLNKRVYSIGSYSVLIPAQGYLVENIRTGTVTQGENKLVTVDVGNCSVNFTVLHNSAQYNGLPVQIIDANGVVYNGNTNAQGNYVFNINAVGPYTARIPSNGSEYINQSDKAGTVNQNQTSYITMTGSNGNLEVSNYTINYPYDGAPYQVNVTYRNAGDIKYYVYCQGDPGFDGGITYGHSNAHIGINETNVITVTVPTGCVWTAQNLNAPGWKGGTFSYSINNPVIDINRNWDVTVSITSYVILERYPGPWATTWRGTFSITVTGSNVPNGLSVNVTPTYSLGEPGIYRDGFSMSPSGTQVINTGSTGSYYVEGVNRNTGAPIKYDGSSSCSFTFGALSGYSNTATIQY